VGVDGSRQIERDCHEAAYRPHNVTLAVSRRFTFSSPSDVPQAPSQVDRFNSIEISERIIMHHFGPLPSNRSGTGGRGQDFVGG
jgi:hypothetical protein